MHYRLLVTDMDGTLLNKHHALSVRNVEAVRRLADGGFGFVLATGRMEATVQPFAARLGVSLPAILYNGAKVVDLATGEVLLEQTLRDDAVRFALRVVGESPVSVNLYSEGRLFVAARTRAVQQFEAKEGVSATEVGDLQDFVAGACPGPVTKLLIIGDEADFTVIRKRLDAARIGARLVNSDPHYLEMLPSESSKGAALKFLCGHIGIPLQETVAMGDAQNDLEMVQMAGLGVAVGNAHPDLLAVADYIAPPHDHDAVAHVIERFFVGPVGSAGTGSMTGS